MIGPESPILRVSIYFRVKVEAYAMRIPYPEIHAVDVMIGILALCTISIFSKQF
jgi:hypothetical protein